MSRVPSILLVEDEDDTRELLGRALERAGYHCSVAAGSTQALERAATTRFDLIVCDVVLGGDDRAGLNLIPVLRERGVSAPVVIMSAYADVQKLKLAINFGAVYFLEKPFRAHELIAVVDRFVNEADRNKPESTPERSDADIQGFLAKFQLTEKEQRVARYLLEGLTSREIADREDNSPRTIRQHVSEIYSKCAVGSRAEFLRLVYLRRG